MGLLNKLFTALRGGAREAGQAIVDANSIRIFEQEIEDAKNNLQKAKQDLTTIMAQEMQAKRSIETITQDIATHEGYTSEALAKNDEALALEVANKIATLEQEKTSQEQIATSYGEHIVKLKSLIKKTSTSIADMQRQLVMVKTTQSVQNAASAIATSSSASGSKLLSAKESLDRIQKRQQLTEDRLKAGAMLDADMGHKNLEEKLAQAGIGKTTTSANDILAKIKAKQG